MEHGATGGLRGAAVEGLLVGLLLAGAAGEPGRAAKLTVGGDPYEVSTIDSADEPREIAAVALRQRSRSSACFAFGTSTAIAPAAGVENDYELGFVDTGDPELQVRQWLDFANDPATNEASQRLVSALHVDDGVPRGRHSIVWAGTKTPGDEDLHLERSDLSVACAKTEIPWRDEGVLPARTRAAVGGYTGAGAEVTSFGHYDELIDLRFSLERPMQCLALASGSFLNPGGGLVDNAYQLVLVTTGEAAGLPVQQIELDDNAGFQDTELLPVSAVRFFPDVGAGERQIRWLGIKEDGGAADLTVELPTLAVVCTRDRLGPEPVSGRAAVGGAHSAGSFELEDDERQSLSELEFTLAKPASCAAFASAWAANPGGQVLDNRYYFGLGLDGTPPVNPLLLEFDDNAGYDDAGALPVAASRSWALGRGEHAIRFQATKQGEGDSDLTVSAPSLAVVCGKAAPEP